MNIKEEESSIFLWIDERVVYPLPVCRRTPQDSDIFLVWEKDQQKQNKFASKHSSGPRRISGLPLKRQRKINRQAPQPMKRLFGQCAVADECANKDLHTHWKHTRADHWNTQERTHWKFTRNAHWKYTRIAHWKYTRTHQNTPELIVENTHEHTHWKYLGIEKWKCSRKELHQTLNSSSGHQFSSSTASAIHSRKREVAREAQSPKTRGKTANTNNKTESTQLTCVTWYR